VAEIRLLKASVAGPPPKPGNLSPPASSDEQQNIEVRIEQPRPLFVHGAYLPSGFPKRNYIQLLPPNHRDEEGIYTPSPGASDQRVMNCFSADPASEGWVSWSDICGSRGAPFISIPFWMLMDANIFVLAYCTIEFAEHAAPSFGIILDPEGLSA